MGGETTPQMDGNNEIDNSNLDNTELPSSFDSNFDAGVEADEETDTKRYIQQLTGKLSQTLNSYNNENGEPDTELGKYVLGMIVKQGVKGMDDNDKKDIIKKINSSDSEENTDDISDEEMELQSESKIIKCTKKQVFESFGIPMSDENEKDTEITPDTKISPDTKKNRRTRPFEAPKKFKE